MPNYQIPRPLNVALVAAFSFSAFGSLTAVAQSSSRSTREDAVRQEHVQSARASWTPTRSSGQGSKQVNAPSRQRTPQPKSSQGSHAVRPQGRAQATRPRPSDSAAPQLAIHQAAYQIPSPPPMEGDLVYQSSIVDGSCDAIGGDCGCDATGCDGMGSCGPSCGCSMCGELPSGRAWRPAITLSLPQDGWISVEGLSMWTEGMALPALVTTSPQGTNPENAGVLTRPGTSTLYGGENILKGSSDAFRLNFGFWLDRCHTWGVGADYLEIDRRTANFSATSTGNPILARPFFNTLTGREDSDLVAFNNNSTIQLTGTVGVQSYSELSGGGFYVRKLEACQEGCNQGLFCGCNERYCQRKEFRVGYRFMQLNEGVSIIEDDVINTGTINRGQFDINDSFVTKNQFNGLDLAWSQRVTRNFFTFESMVRLGIGNTRQSVSIAGQTTITDQNGPGGTTTTYPEGILALQPNSGLFKQNQFTVLPEINLTMGYQLTDHVKLTLGYTGIYWSNVVRPGQHIPTMANPDYFAPQIPSTGDPRPLFAFDTTDYWVQGLSYGLEYRW